MKGLYIFFGILCFLYYTYSRPNGSPQDSCFYMTPRHIHPHTFRRVFPTKAMGLYNITTSADVFRPDRPIRVTLWGPPFKGFMIVAAEEGAKDWPTGIFYSEDGGCKRLSCLARGDTVTHQNNSYKDSVSALWYGPENMMSEQIQFIATVVVNLTIYYTNIRSGMIRLDPGLHVAAGAGGEGGAPVAVTMDPWLSGQSVTKAPTNWWSNLAGGGARGGASNNAWGANTAGGGNSWGANSGTGGWGASQTGAGGTGGWGASQTGSGGTGGWDASQTGSGGTGGWAASQTGGANAGGNNGWGANSGTGWGASQTGTGTGGNGQWGAQSSNTAWGTGTGARGANNQAGSSWGSNSGSSGAAGGGAGTNTGNGWNANGDWQQVGQGSVTASSWSQRAAQYQNPDGSLAWGNGQKSWHAPGDGKPIWNWNSGKIPTTKAPATTQAPSSTKGQGTTASAWSAQALLELVQRLGFGPVARP